jgi:hypothetical protein
MVMAVEFIRDSSLGCYHISNVVRLDVLRQRTARVAGSGVGERKGRTVTGELSSSQDRLRA